MRVIIVPAVTLLGRYVNVGEALRAEPDILEPCMVVGAWGQGGMVFELFPVGMPREEAPSSTLEFPRVNL